MKKILFILFIALTVFTAGCDDTLYEVYNDFTGPVESVMLPDAMSVEVYTSEKLKATVYPKMTDNKNVTWSSADSSIASVDSDGVVTGNIVNQSTIITVTTEEGGFTAQCKVTVVPKPIPITKLTLPETLSIGTGQQRILSYSYTPSDATKATNSYMTWKSSNTAVAAVDGDGTVTGVANGTATITITSVHWGKNASCEVTVGDPTYSVIYKKNDGSGEFKADSTVYKTAANFTVYSVTTFARQNYNFSGWNTEADGTGTPYTAGASYTMGTSDIVLYAQWTEITSDPTYTITYNKNDGSGEMKIDPIVYKTGAEFAVYPANTFTRQNYNFSGWNTKTGGTGTSYTSGELYTMGNSDIVLYAQWTEITPDPTYTVTYIANAPSGTSSTGVVPLDNTIYKNGDEATLKDNTGTTGTNGLECAGYRFRCWSTTPNGAAGTLYNPGAKYPVTKNLIFYAQWGYGVTYNGNGYTGGLLPVDKTPYLSGAAVTVKTSFTASKGNLVKIENTSVSTSKAYRCSGWTDGTNTYTEGATFTINSSVTLTAIWTEYKIGDTGPAGGLIFYIANSYTQDDYGSWKYLEAAPEDLSSGIQWTTNDYLNTAIPAAPLGTTETTVGRGRANNNRIVIQVNDLNKNSQYAAGLINSYSKNGYSDWGLPSKDELGYMYTNLRAKGLGGFDDQNYWSSSEGVTGKAWYQYFTTGQQIEISKSSQYRVRPVRGF